MGLVSKSTLAQYFVVIACCLGLSGCFNERCDRTDWEEHAKAVRALTTEVQGLKEESGRLGDNLGVVAERVDTTAKYVGRSVECLGREISSLGREVRGLGCRIRKAKKCFGKENGDCFNKGGCEGRKASIWTRIGIGTGIVVLVGCYIVWIWRKIKQDDAEKLKGLKYFSIIVYGIERCFRVLELFPFQCILSGKPALQEKLSSDISDRARWKLTSKRTKKIDLYIFAWFIVEVFSIVVFGALEYRPLVLVWIIWVLGILRIVDIIQANVNIVLFDRLRTNREYRMASVVRTIVLTTLNYFQMLIWFGLFYCTLLNKLKDVNDWTDAFYFSVITQLTIGYGDVSPLGVARIVAAIQGIIGLFFMILILARFVAHLPKVETLLGDNR